MEFDLQKSIALLERTPAVLRQWLSDLPDEWTMNNEGPDTWSPFDILGHFVHGEKTDWMARLKLILSEEGDKTFKPFDRFAQFSDSKGKSLKSLLDEFESLRKHNLKTLKSLGLGAADFQKTGVHPVFGTVTLRQLLATWVVHDQNHLAQIARVMAKQYQDEVGPWREYLPLLNR